MAWTGGSDGSTYARTFEPCVADVRMARRCATWAVLASSASLGNASASAAARLAELVGRELPGAGGHVLGQVPVIAPEPGPQRTDQALLVQLEEPREPLLAGG